MRALLIPASLVAVPIGRPVSRISSGYAATGRPAGLERAVTARGDRDAVPVRTRQIHAIPNRSFVVVESRGYHGVAVKLLQKTRGCGAISKPTPAGCPKDHSTPFNR